MIYCYAVVAQVQMSQDLRVDQILRDPPASEIAKEIVRQVKLRYRCVENETAHHFLDDVFVDHVSWERKRHKIAC